MAIRYFEYGADFSNDDYCPLSTVSDAFIPANNENLFSFLSADLVSLERLAKQYLQCLNFEQLESALACDKELQQSLLNGIVRLHPFFSYCESNAEFLLNCMIVRYIINNMAIGVKDAMGEEKFYALLRAVCSFDTGVTDNMEFYCDFVGTTPHFGNNRVLRPLLDLQDELSKIVFLVFDCTNAELAELSIRQRATLYESIYGDGFLEFSKLEVKRNFIPSEELRHQAAVAEFSDFVDGENCTDLLAAVDSLRANPLAAIPQELRPFIQAARQIQNDNLEETIVIHDLRELFQYEIYEMIDRGIRLKRCKYCGEYFIFEKGNMEYCNRIVAGETKPCNVIGKTRTYQQRVAQDIYQTLYRRAYKTHNARVRNGSMTKAAFNLWAQQAEIKWKQAQSGDLSMEEYEQWLKI